MDRDILNQLDAWKASSYRKPLLIKGARQVGKTWALREFGNTRYRNCVYLTLEEIAPGIPSEYAQLFERTRDPRRIISSLALATGQSIDPGETLIILDEIQDCPAAIGALKYFCDDAPEYHVACAGSLLGVRLSRDTASFPVGKVEFLTMYPLTFSEYLRAAGAPHLDEYARGISTFEPIPDIFANQFKERLSQYFSTGGMPEAVVRWVRTGDVASVDKVLTDLLDAYERDFAKQGGGSLFAKLSLVWHSIPSQLARENKKFVWGLVREGARAREYEDAVEWLSNAGLVQRVFLNSGKGVPLSAYDETSAFKVYCMDVGLLRRMSRLDSSVFLLGEAPFFEFKGAFAENYALQSLLSQLDADPRYWTNKKPLHEIDLLIQMKNTIVPIEVKSGTSIDSPSLKYYAKKHSESTPLRVRLSARNLSLNGSLLNIPLYLADHSSCLIEKAMSYLDAGQCCASE